MRTADFDYDLPTGLIAQHPAEPRDACRLMVVERGSGQIDHKTFRDLPEYLHEGDVLVVNETRVLPARLKGAKDETGGAVEVLLLRPRYGTTWECLVRPGRRLKPGAKVVFGDGLLTGLIVDVIEETGGRVVTFSVREGTFMEAVHALGEVPLPPYITATLDDPEKYQTVYAAQEHSVAAPTAGLHFTEELLEKIQRQGVHLAKVELDVGLDTFRPVTAEDPREHRMHAEHYRVPAWTADAVNDAHRRGSRVFAVGTTTVRALESAYNEETRLVEASEGVTDLFILPGFSFGAVDALVTNFHMPRSTLLMMVSAFAGRDLIMRAYETAKRERYRFLSFGDAMLIV
ncbi:MAG: tRNA preQ1(34) S-adenosylmethionine ribosyltransferase-isomerase QueA [Anaerosomatales bacterium]|nr:tRNA preQ1(34) S-adenosylmethionine ribosyltransferase-isomerase QueA [Anaerosomatales bacterium]MDI6844402.1 tRNA preQ1(34) S-adenosylmethionine ribosyltransferase-isomerase QueA [Anaerosomatales bacterium]GAV31549.1 queuosine biosynthesis protein QueA [Coriobacteriaceae bacterium EMTCatB1]